MSTFTALVILATLTAGGSPTGPVVTTTHDNVYKEIEARYTRGAIDADHYYLYRVAALRDPSRLPADLQRLDGTSPVSCGSRYMVEAFQHVVRTGAYGGELHALLQPPADYAYVLDSINWPIRVSYSNAGQAAYAQAIIDAADLAYDKQITEFGFYQPVIEPGYEPYRMYIDDAGTGAAAYTAPYEENPATSYNTAFSYIVVDPNLGMDGVGTTVAHEINHSMQMSMDWFEDSTFMENTAVFMEGLTNPDWFADTLWFVPYFQETPWRALDWFEDLAGYMYGGVLWLHYLADKMGPDDQGVMAAEIWQACIQYNMGGINEPDYYDAIETVAAARGADASTMEALVTDFAEARYFIADNDDGQHMTLASEFPGAEPVVSKYHSVDDLPIVEESPSQQERPAPYGTSYVLVDLLGATRPILFGFDGDNNTRWAVRVVRFGDGVTTVSEPVTLDPDTWYGELTVDPEGFDQVLLVVVNLGPEDYDPDSNSWITADYYDSIEEVHDPPVVTAVAPGAVIRGQQNLHLRLLGSGFFYGEPFDVVFDDPMFEVVSIDAIRDAEVMFTLTVPAGTPVGVYDVTVVNGDGQATRGVALLCVLDELFTTDPGPKPKGCTTGGAPGPLALFFVALLLWGRRRRR